MKVTKLSTLYKHHKAKYMSRVRIRLQVSSTPFKDESTNDMFDLYVQTGFGIK